MMKTPILSELIVISVGVYLLYGLFLFLYQGKMVYYPDSQDFNACSGFVEYEKIEYQGTRFYFLKQNQDIIVFYHGNAGSACDRNYLKKLLEPTGKSILIVEYAGYSNDTRKPAKGLIMKDARNINDWILEKGFKQVSIMGESIGTGVAAFHSSIAKVDKVALLSPFSSTAEIAPVLFKAYPLRLLMTENYDNIQYLSKYSNEILIVHGAEDRIIKPKYSKKLFDALPSKKKEYVLVQDVGHNDMYDSDVVQSKITNFLS